MMRNELTFEEIRRKTRAMMPDVLDDLKSLIRYPSVAFLGHPVEPVNSMAEATVTVLKRYGLQDVRLVDIPGGYPAVYGEIPPPPGAPTIMMYAHYDVQPAKERTGGILIPGHPSERMGAYTGVEPLMINREL